jgi:hypothetical protein
MSFTAQDAQLTAEQLFRQGGWGPQLKFGVERAVGKPLVLQFRLPDGVALFDLQAMIRTARGAPASVGRAADALERVGSAAGVIVLGAMCAARKPDSDLEVLATMTVSLSEVAGPPVIEQHLLPDSERAHQQVERISNKVTRIQRLSSEALEAGHEPALMLVVQYLVQTQFGALAFAFSTTHEDMFGEWARTMYRKVVETCWIGELARLY